jgi:hypothetical protein
MQETFKELWALFASGSSDIRPSGCGYAAIVDEVMHRHRRGLVLTTLLHLIFLHIRYQPFAITSFDELAMLIGTCGGQKE